MEEKKSTPTIRELYPSLAADDLREAEENLEQYLCLALRIYERIIADQDAYAQLRALIGTSGTVGCITSRSQGSAGDFLKDQP